MFDLKDIHITHITHKKVMSRLVHTPASEVTEALKDIEWLTMPLIDKRLAGELGELGRFLCKKPGNHKVSL